MLRLCNLSLARGTRVLYRDVSLSAAPAERIGLIGSNGCGKSSLLAAVLGQLSVEAGQIEAPRPERIADVAQDIDTTASSALEYVLEGHPPLRLARIALQQAEEAGDDLQIAHAYAQLADIDPGAVTAQALRVMHGLGFAPDAPSLPMRDFSGGWRNRLALARALLTPADLLLLDEPTNHLDLDSVIWLETWLRRQSATVLVISHDREFLDRCVNTIWHIDGGAIRRYAGDYSAFEAALLERNRQQDAQARSYQRTAAHLQRFVDRFRAKATKARQAQSRLKMLQRLVQVEPSRAQHEWRFEFREPRKLPQRLVDGEALTLGYGDTAVLRDVRLAIAAGDRIGILGVNGAGKSTLVKTITGHLAPMGGELRRSPDAAIGYFAQHQLDQLDLDESALDQLRRLTPQVREQELRDFLGSFRFSGELATTAVGRLSGGERARCALALLAWQRPNLLVLDEPTNHLDMETREALTVALSSFAGALLLVSHDRHLLRATVDTLWLVHEGLLSPFEGDLDEYAALVIDSRRDRDESRLPRLQKDAVNRREERRLQAQERERLAQLRRPLQQRLQEIETQLEASTAQLRAMDMHLADPAVYHSGESAKIADLLQQRAALDKKIAHLEAQWLQSQEELAAMS
ncbi:MAG TPA: ATP-binding cassette domain-containing protein [Burkholderiaceae bacterium]|nr:ATP-binding cassette domain-containing protein [Burkholderiaceae bacterium]